MVVSSALGTAHRHYLLELAGNLGGFDRAGVGGGLSAILANTTVKFPTFKPVMSAFIRSPCIEDEIRGYICFSVVLVGTCHDDFGHCS